MWKGFGQLLGTLIGSSLSPSWYFLNLALKGYFNLQQAMLGPQQMLQEYARFNAYTAAHPDHVMWQLIPQLIVVTVASLLFVALCGKGGGLLFTKLVTLVHRVSLKVQSI